MCVSAPACTEAAWTAPPRWLIRNNGDAANGRRELVRQYGRRRDQVVVADCRIRPLVATSGRAAVSGNAGLRGVDASSLLAPLSPASLSAASFANWSFSQKSRS